MTKCGVNFVERWETKWVLGWPKANTWLSLGEYSKSTTPNVFYDRFFLRVRREGRKGSQYIFFQFCELGVS